MRLPRGETDPTSSPYQYGFAREALWALAATETYGLHVTVDPLRVSERAPRRVYKKIGEERRGDYPEAEINLEYEGKTNLK